MVRKAWAQGMAVGCKPSLVVVERRGKLCEGSRGKKSKGFEGKIAKGVEGKSIKRARDKMFANTKPE
ncbi:hypothetical protein HPP92_009497 [Vanilla planifolia]|uniref:Uncharacterized protein n=1 Tax=Vanilla planifolia TaxID=51239 RepID=A0A835RFF1_VANPL|nr:hypothetical protein HPP92_009497 [Vanilla planifolia]